MKIAFLDPHIETLKLYQTAFYGFNADYFTDLNKFERVFFNQYDIIVLSHRMGDKNWVDVVNDLKTDAIFIVTMTFPAEYYKSADPDAYEKIQLINKIKNVFPMIKEDIEKMYDFIEDKQIFSSMKEVVKKIEV